VKISLETIFRSSRHIFFRVFIRIMRMINPLLILSELKLYSFIFSRVGVSCPPLQYDRRSFTVGHIGVRIGMCGRAQRYRKASCPFNISETSCLSHVRPMRQVIFHVFLLLFLHATFKSYKMLNVLIVSITVLKGVEGSYKGRNR
jgi:hypothetical protein